MVRGDDGERARAFGCVQLGAVGESERARIESKLSCAQNFQNRRKTDRAQADHDAQSRERVELLDEIGKAVAQLARRRPVVWGCAARRGGDETIAKLQSVVAIDGLRL